MPQQLTLFDTSEFPPLFRNMFHCTKCGFWYDDELRGPSEQCRPCYWGIGPDMKRVITRKMVIMDLAQVAERLLAMHGTFNGVQLRRISSVKTTSDHPGFIHTTFRVLDGPLPELELLLRPNAS